MISHEHAPVDVDPASLHQAQHTWSNFTRLGFFFVLHIIGLLVLMAIFLL